MICMAVTERCYALRRSSRTAGLKFPVESFSRIVSGLPGELPAKKEAALLRQLLVVVVENAYAGLVAST